MDRGKTKKKHEKKQKIGRSVPCDDTQWEGHCRMSNLEIIAVFQWGTLGVVENLGRSEMVLASSLDTWRSLW